MSEFERNNLRYERLSEHRKSLLNALAFNEFSKPLKQRLKAVDLIDIVEFKL